MAFTSRSSAFQITARAAARNDGPVPMLHRHALLGYQALLLSGRSISKVQGALILLKLIPPK